MFFFYFVSLSVCLTPNHFIAVFYECASKGKEKKKKKKKKKQEKKPTNRVRERKIEPHASVVLEDVNGISTRIRTEREKQIKATGCLARPTREKMEDDDDDDDKNKNNNSKKKTKSDDHAHPPEHIRARAHHRNGTGDEVKRGKQTREREIVAVEQRT